MAIRPFISIPKDIREWTRFLKDAAVTEATATTATNADNADELGGQPPSFYRDASNINAGTLADARIASTIARDTEVTAAISDHVALADPHIQYALESALPTFAQGTYTPTLTNVANLDASTAYQCQYLRVGATVTVSGRVDVDPTLAATSTQLGISLPVASNFGAIEDCAGVAFASGIAGQGAAILADVANDRAQLQYVSGDVTNQGMYFSFTYQVI